MITLTDMATWGFVGLAGDLDTTDSDELLSAVDELVGIGAVDLTVDLSRVTFIGPDAVDALLVASRLLETAGGQMGLVGMSGSTRQLRKAARSLGTHVMPSFCGRCRTFADRDWRWCPDCGGRLGAVGASALRPDPPATDTLFAFLADVGRNPEAQ